MAGGLFYFYLAFFEKDSCPGLFLSSHFSVFSLMSCISLNVKTEFESHVAPLKTVSGAEVGETLDRSRVNKTVLVCPLKLLLFSGQLCGIKVPVTLERNLPEIQPGMRLVWKQLCSPPLPVSAL